MKDDIQINVIKADYSNPQHAESIRELLDAYASDPMGGSVPLAQEVKDTVVDELKKLPNAFSLLANIGNHSVGLMNCFQLLSTFQAKPFVNVHDVVVLPDYRGKGISQLMFSTLEKIAIEKGCCKITLEVLSGNQAAQAAYTKSGFSAYQLDASTGQALYWQKII